MVPRCASVLKLQVLLLLLYGKRLVVQNSKCICFVIYHLSLLGVCQEEKRMDHLLTRLSGLFQ
jgi:hypothetical protein